MKILVDMNLSPKWVDFLIGNGIETVHWLAVGSHDDPDTDIISYARIHDFTIFTNDLDFGFLHAINYDKKPSVIQTRTGVLSTERIGDIVVSAIKQLSDDLENGALVTVDKNKIRVSLLPLGFERK